MLLLKNKNYFSIIVCVICFLLVCSSAAALADGKADKSQTELWLTHHLEAWDDVASPEVSVSGCVIQRTTRNQSHILNVTGLILPVEVLSVDNQNHATVRARVREVRSGNYAMSRECNAGNNFCSNRSGDFNPEPFVDFRVTFARPYSGPERSLTSLKADQLQSALTHYARLCDNNFEAWEENIRF